MLAEKKSYQQVFKATSLFGGIQIFHILITIARSKVIALLIGAEGMGIAALLLSPLRLITSASNLGLDQSAVREIASAGALKEEDATQTVIAILKKITWLTAIGGGVILIILSPLLSQWSFQSNEYIFSFVWLGLALVFNQLAASRIAILQGLRKLKFLAKSNLYGALAGFLITIPLYYFFGVEGIIPAIIITSLFLFLFAQYFYRKLNIQEEFITFKEAVRGGKPMLKLGVTLSLSAFVGLLVAYLVQIFIGYQSGEVAVGYYSAGIVILNTYVGIIFRAMSSDYFPRLSAVSGQMEKLSQTVVEQAFIAILLITPIIVLFIAFASPLITLLYSNEFDATAAFVRWGILGMLFKAVSWSVGYIIIAKGDSRLFMKTTIGFNSVLLLLNILGYYYGGLEGLGISLLVYFVIHFITVQFIVAHKYSYRISKDLYLIFGICLLFCLIAFGTTYINSVFLKYGILLLCILSTFIYSYQLLDKRIGFKIILSFLFNKKAK